MSSEVISFENSNGFLIRNHFNEQEQKELYLYLLELVDKSLIEESKKLNPDYVRPWPIAWYQMAYTQESNCSEPKKIFEACKKILEKVEFMYIRSNNFRLDKHN